MAMSKGTTRRSIRVEDELWEAAKAEFALRGKNISDEIRVFLREEVEGGRLATSAPKALRQAAGELEYGNPIAQFLYDRADDIEQGIRS